jgi:signal transduction histidine kinase
LEKRTVQIADVFADADYDQSRSNEFMAALSGQPTRTILGVPIAREGAVVGIIIARRNEVRPFNERQIGILETFARQAAVAIANVRLFDETKEALEQQTATAEILKVMARSPEDVQPVLDAIAENAARVCGASDAHVYRVDGESLKQWAHYGPIPGLAPGETLPLDRGSLVGRCIVDQRTILIADAAQLDPAEFPVSAGLQKRWGYRTSLSVPLIRDGKSIGGIAIRRMEVDPFTPRQIELLETFAQQAVIAIENVRLFNETRDALEQQTATAEVLKTINRSAFDLQSIFDVVVQNAHSLCRGNWAYLFRRAGDEFRLVATSGGIPELITYEREHPTPISDRTLVGRVALRRAPVHLPDMQTDPDYDWPINREFGVHSAVGLPILRGDEVVGVIGVARMAVNPFTDDEIRLVATFADQAAIAIENVRLFNETKESLEQQTAIADILRVISASPTDIQPVLDAIAESATRFAAAEDAAVLLTRDGRLVPVAHHGPIPMPLAVPVDRGSVSGRATVEGRTIHAADVTADDEYPTSKEAGLQDGQKTVLAVPLLRAGEALGVIVMRRREARPFSERQIELAQTFANQAAIALENVRLFNETKESLEQQTAVAEVLKTISRSVFDLQPVLDIVLENAVRLAGADIAWMGRAEGDRFRRVAESSAFPADVRAQLDADAEQTGGWITIGRGGVMGRVLAHKATLHVADIAAEPTLQHARVVRATASRAVLGVPMLREGRAIGAIVLARYQVRPFSAREIELVQTFADQAAIAIENVRLFNEIQDKSQQLEIASRHKSEFLATMSHELRTPLNAIIGFSEVLLQQMFGTLNEKQTEYLNDVLSSGRHLLSLINDILDLSKIEAGRMELDLDTFSLVEALQNGVTMVRERAARHAIALELRIADGVDLVEADPRKVKQIVFNLLSNAVKFTPDGGRVEVRAAHADGDITVSVRDTGIGIAPEDCERIFEEFQQARRQSDRSREGTGLGLALSRRFVELHGGRIWVESEIGRGSTFTFTLPLAVAAATT